MIRFTQKKKEEFHKETAFDIFGKTFWLAKYDKNYLMVFLLTQLCVQVGVSFIWVELYKCWGIEGYETGWEVLTSPAYFTGAIIYTVLYGAFYTKLTYHKYAWTYSDGSTGIHFQNSKDKYEYEKPELSETKKRNFFGKDKIVYYS